MLNVCEKPSSAGMEKHAFTPFKGNVKTHKNTNDIMSPCCPCVLYRYPSHLFVSYACLLTQYEINVLWYIVYRPHTHAHARTPARPPARTCMHTHTHTHTHLVRVSSPSAFTKGKAASNGLTRWFQLNAKPVSRFSLEMNTEP